MFTRRDTAATLLYGLLVKILLDQTDFFSCMAKRSEQEFTEIFVTLFQAHCLEYTMQVYDFACSNQVENTTSESYKNTVQKFTY